MAAKNKGTEKAKERGRQAQARAKQRASAQRRAAVAQRNAPPAPVPAWMNGDKTDLPMSPPGKGAP